MPIEAGQYVVGGDLGGTRFRAVLADHEGTIVGRAPIVDHPGEGREAVMASMIETIRKVIEPVGADRVAGVGLAAPGPLNPWTGVVYSPPNLPGWGAEPLKDIMERALGLRCHLGNDANLAALAEHRFGSARGTETMIYITVSTGIGGGIVDRGNLFLGGHGLAGEVGHMTLVPDGPVCACGNHGCLEALAAGPAINRDAVARLRAGEASALRDTLGDNLADLTTRDVVAAARAGDPLAADVFRRAATYLGIGVANLIHLFNPEVVALGGGVTNAGDLLFDPVREQVQIRVMASMKQGVRIVPAALGEDVVLLGAVALVMAHS